MQKMNADEKFNTITNSKFKEPSSEVLESLACEPAKRDGFFKRLFGDKKKEKQFKEKKKEGIFSFLKKKEEE
jgi:penicillin-binding protein 1A